MTSPEDRARESLADLLADVGDEKTPLMKLPSTAINPELVRLLEQSKELPPLTPAQIREQRISFVYGNLSLSNPNITREMVAEEHDRIYSNDG